VARGEGDAARAARRLALNGIDLIHRAPEDAMEDQERPFGALAAEQAAT
jgi:hypothetical protein